MSLSQSQAILEELKRKIDKRKHAISNLNPMENSSESTLNGWEREEAYCWLYASDWYIPLMRKPQIEKMPPYYQQSAEPIYDEWLDQERDIIYRGHVIQPPINLSIAEYLNFLVNELTKRRRKTTIWLGSLYSFLAYLREDMPFDLQGDLEILFPRKMEICRGRHKMILRKINPQVYPIDIITASKIIQKLVQDVLEGRPNAQRVTAQALGFAWLCLTSGSSNILTSEDSLFQTPLDRLKHSKSNRAYDFFLSECHITVDSMFGPVDLPISKILYDYFLSLSIDMSLSAPIFNAPWSSLLRRLYVAIKAAKQSSASGDITFLTFMSRPHEAIGYR